MNAVCTRDTGKGFFYKTFYFHILLCVKVNFASKSVVMSVAALSAPSAFSMAVVPGFDANVLIANDDQSTGAVSLGFTANFVGQEFDSVFVNNNGNITFDESLSSFTPLDLTSTEQVVIAPFFADIDTRGVGSNPVTYGSGTQDGRTAFGVNDVDVGYFDSADDLLNWLQLILVDRSDVSAGDFDFISNYDQIQFETGEASEGKNGLGGDSARAGFSLRLDAKKRQSVTRCRAAPATGPPRPAANTACGPGGSDTIC